jgi:hypothetical protein
LKKRELQLNLYDNSNPRQVKRTSLWLSIYIGVIAITTVLAVNLQLQPGNCRIRHPYSNFLPTSTEDKGIGTLQ